MRIQSVSLLFASLAVAGCATTSKTEVLPSYTLDNGQRLQDVVTVASEEEGAAPVITVVKTFDVSHSDTVLVSHDSASQPGMGVVVAGALAGSVPTAAAIVGAAAIEDDDGDSTSIRLKNRNQNSSTNNNTNANDNDNENTNVNDNDNTNVNLNFVP